MWVVIKSNKKNIEILKNNIRKNFSSVQFYIPRIKINEKNDKRKNSTCIRKISIL